MVKNLAIIPARTGSKRIPDKNIVNFMGKPLIAYTIEAAIESDLFDDIIVSTDSPEYAKIAEKYGAWVPFLRKEYNDDYSPLNKVYLSVLDMIKTELGKEYSNICALQATCPLRDASIIKTIYNFFLDSDSKTVLSCSKFNFMNPWWSFKMAYNSEADFMLSNPVKTRSQDNEELFYPTGAVGFAKVKDFIEDSTFYGKGHKFFSIDWKYAVDIDNYQDLEFAKAVFSMINQTKET